MIQHILGQILTWILAIALIATLPVEEILRRDIAPAAPRTKGPFILSALGIILAALFLAGCGMDQAPIRREIQIVKEPIPIQPIAPADVPKPPEPLGPRPPSLRQSADRALAGFCEAIAYVLKAHPLLRLSAGLPPEELPKYPECEGAN